MLELIEVYSISRKEQCEIDSVYTTFCEVEFKEIDTYLLYSLTGKKTRKSFKIHKLFWNGTLSQMWKNMNIAEHKLLKCKTNRREKYYNKQAFINSRKRFDKELRRSERLYNRKLLKEIDSF